MDTKQIMVSYLARTAALTHCTLLVRTSRSTLSPLHGLNGGESHNKLPKSDKEVDLIHLIRHGEGSINALGDGRKAEGVSGQTDKVLHNQPNTGEHGSAAVSNFGIAKEGKEGFVCIGQVQGVKDEFFAHKINGASHIRHGGQGSGCLPTHWWGKSGR
jgi:hypothetical protein